MNFIVSLRFQARKYFLIKYISILIRNNIFVIFKRNSVFTGYSLKNSHELEAKQVQKTGRKKHTDSILHVFFFLFPFFIGRGRPHSEHLFCPPPPRTWRARTKNSFLPLILLPPDEASTTHLRSEVNLAFKIIVCFITIGITEHFKAYCLFYYSFNICLRLILYLVSEREYKLS